MIELYYDEFRLAYIMASHDIGAKSGMSFLQRVYSEDFEFIHPMYRGHKKDFFLKVLYWVDYLADRDSLDLELAGLERDFNAMGREFIRENFMFPYSNMDLFVMEMRLKIRFLGSQDYVRVRLRTLLRRYGYKRRSSALMDHVRDCMLFYHIQPYFWGGEECDIRKIGLDELISFRVL